MEASLVECAVCVSVVLMFNYTAGEVILLHQLCCTELKSTCSSVDQSIIKHSIAITAEVGVNVEHMKILSDTVGYKKN